jgi:hypothetical protein
VSSDARGLACRSMMRAGAAADLPKFAKSLQMSQTGIPGPGATWVWSTHEMGLFRSGACARAEERADVEC